MKKIQKLLIVATLFSLSSCSINLTTSISSYFSSSVGDTSSSDSSEGNSSSTDSSEGNSSSASSSQASSSSEELSSSYSSSLSLSDVIQPPKTKLKYNSKSYNPGFSSTIGEQKVLVVPISLAGDTTYEWTQANLDMVDSCFFKQSDEYERDNLAWYYEKASNGRIHVTGEVSEVYESSVSKAMVTTSDEEANYVKLEGVMNDAITFISAKINLDDYDTDDDGYLDAVHFIFDESDDEDWYSPLWPYMSYIFNEQGTINSPKVWAYSSNNLGKFNSATAAIHEQGHIFGLSDYYNYDQSAYGIDYVGNADMQTGNLFDWNSFSKMSAGWADPYVVDGSLESSVEITIKPASVNNDCIVIANNWSDSPFDEYMLIELFSPYGNNEEDWTYWNSNYGILGKGGGIRLYHVDSRLWGYNADDFENGSIVSDIDSSDYDFMQLGCTNSTNNQYSYYSPKCLEDYHLLQIIQKGNVNTFGTPKTREYLNSTDLFKTGDSFTMEKYGKNFFVNKTTFDNGEEFPFKIDFVNVTTDEATVRITKI